MNFLFIAVGMGRYLSGGDTNFIEIGKRLIRKGHTLTVVTSDEGRKGCERAGLYADFCIFDKGESKKKGLLGTALSLLRRMLKACLLLRKRKLGEKTIIFATSDMLFDVFPSLFARGKDVKRISLLHEVKPSPIRGYRGEVTGRPNFPGLRSILNHLQQQFSLLCFRHNYHLVIPTTQFNRSFLLKKLPNDKVSKSTINLGIDWATIKAANSVSKKYDACWIGRFHREQKGCDDLVETWQSVCQTKKEAKLALIGGNIATGFGPLIRRAKLEENVIFTGFLSETEKFKTLKESKIFVFPSYYEGWGIVIGEAMACGLPVVAYDLPIYRDIYPKGMVRVRIGDKKAFANEVMRILENEEDRQSLSKQAKEVASWYNWDKTSENFLHLAHSLIEG